jgi:hypothetical protein
MKITVKSFSKTLLYVSQVDVSIQVAQGTPTVRTNTLFTKYFYTKEIHIPSGTLFSVYNCCAEDLIIELDTAGCSIVKEEYDDCQYIGTGRIRKGKDRLSIFDKFMDHYSSLGYKILTADTDHLEFNRAASRNVLASVFPNKVIVLVDGDAFYSRDQIDTAVRYAEKNDVIVKPTKFVCVDDKKINAYSGYCWVVKTSLWPGMDERCLTWGAEDIILMENRLIHTEVLNNGVAQVLNHIRDEIGKPNNFELLKDYRDRIGRSLSKDKVLSVFTQHCGYGTYGHFSTYFSEPRTANNFYLQEQKNL